MGRSVADSAPHMCSTQSLLKLNYFRNLLFHFTSKSLGHANNSLAFFFAFSMRKHSPHSLQDYIKSPTEDFATSHQCFIE